MMCVRTKLFRLEAFDYELYVHALQVCIDVHLYRSTFHTV